MGGLLTIIVGICYLLWVKNVSSQQEVDKKYERIIGWLLIGVGIGYILAT